MIRSPKNHMELLQVSQNARSLIRDPDALARLAELPRTATIDSFMELFAQAFQGKRGATWKTNPPLFAAGQCLHLARQVAHAGACVLDVGCGTARYRALFKGSRYIGFDIADPSFDYDYKHLDWVADANFGFGLKDSAADVVLCLAVLEHLRAPWVAAKECARVLRPGGHLIVLVPFIRPEHAQPHDFFRFTRWGVQSLMEDVGLTTVKIWNAVGTRSTVEWLAKSVANQPKPRNFFSKIKRSISRRKHRSALLLAAKRDEEEPLPDLFPHSPAYVAGHFTRPAD